MQGSGPFLTGLGIPHIHVGHEMTEKAEFTVSK
jgi:hypothetical protein